MDLPSMAMAMAKKAMPKTIDLSKYVVTIESDGEVTLNVLFLMLFGQGGGSIENCYGCDAFWRDVDTDQPLRIIIDGSLLGMPLALEMNGVSRLVDLGDGSNFGKTSGIAGKLTAIMSGNPLEFTLVIERGVSNGQTDLKMTVIMG